MGRRGEGGRVGDPPPPTMTLWGEGQCGGDLRGGE